MLIGILVGVTVLLGAGCGALGWSYARRVAGATSAELGALVIALKKLPQGERLGALAKKSRPESWEHRMAEEALSAPDDAARIAAVNEALDDIDHILKAGASFPPAAIRIAFFGAALLGVAAYLGSYELRWPVLILGIGGVAALTCVEAGRAGRRGADAQRRTIDDLLVTTLGPLVEAAPDQSGRPKRRGGRR